MRYAKLGKTGLEVSAITLGCMSFGEPGGRGRPWTLDEAECRDLVRQALDIPWSPLARGKLTRPWDETTTRGETDEFGQKLYRDEDRAIIGRVLEVAAKRDIAPAQVALAWLLRNPAVTSPIVGVTRSSHLSDAIAAVDVALDADEVAYLEEPYVPHSVAGHQ